MLALSGQMNIGKGLGEVFWFNLAQSFINVLLYKTFINHLFFKVVYQLEQLVLCFGQNKSIFLAGY